MALSSYDHSITMLDDHEVFVFGSSILGFHGAGAAGFASFGEWGNVWREKGYGDRPNGWRGRWNIKGVGWGFQQGTNGKSYAIPTVKKPGDKRSMPLPAIRKHIECFNYFSKGFPHWKFYVSQGNFGLNGYEADEMREIWLDKIEWSANVFFKSEFLDGYKKSN